MQFSKRSYFGAEEDPLTAASTARRAAGLPILDMTESNPTRCGLGLGSPLLLPPLLNAANAVYYAEPFGPVTARRAIAREYYGSRGVAVATTDLMLTASTSEAYSHLFRLLCEAGDEVLVPQPSYQLFDMLAQLHDVQLREYPLRFHDRWQIDLQALEASITPKTRAIVVVHPNNPTGHFCTAAEREGIDRVAARHGLAVLVDEVFADYRVESNQDVDSFAAQPHPEALTFVMSGLSKVLALPQMKLAWTLTLGPAELRAEAQQRLEFIADAFLSVGAPVSNALSSWLEHAGKVQRQVLTRLQINLEALDRELRKQHLVSRLPVEAGWSVLLRVPAVEPGADFAIRLLEERGVLVHPGSFFGMPDRGWVVLSLLASETEFLRGTQLLLEGIAALSPVHS